MNDTPKPVPNKAPYFMTPELVQSVYALVGEQAPQRRLISKVVLTLEAGKAATIEETTVPLMDVPGSPPQVPVGENTETKGNA